jgi:putative transposase
MKLTEKHTIRRGDARYDILDQECYKSKNLYNATLYAIRQHFFENKSYLSYYTLQPQFQKKMQSDYYALPTKVAQQTMKMVDQNFRSFFRSLKSFKANPGRFKARPRIPKYLDKTEGRYMLVYTSQAISKKVLDREGKIKLSGIDVSVPTRVTFPQLCEVRVVRRPNAYVIEVVYDDKKEVMLKGDNGRYAAIDLGVSNFATVTSNVKGFRPFVAGGRYIKSVNRYYNKKVSHYKSVLETRNGRKTSGRLRSLGEKRDNRVKDFLHKSSRMIVNQLVSNDINTLIVGSNKDWKQDVNMGKTNNQSFVQLPHGRFIDLLRYKCEREGISLVVIEESYTSKCSFLDGEEICKHETYMGRRIRRGLFRSGSGRLINADVNGSYNILRKCMPKAFDADGVEGVLVHPVVIKTTNGFH